MANPDLEIGVSMALNIQRVKNSVRTLWHWTYQSSKRRRQLASTLSYLLTTSKTNLLFGMIGNLPPRGIVFNRPATLDSSLDSHSVCVIFMSKLEYEVFESIEITFKSVLVRRHSKTTITRLLIKSESIISDASYSRD